MTVAAGEGPHLRIARPVSDLARSCRLYCHGLGLQVLGCFRDHAGFDGVMLGMRGCGYHFEFTHAGGRAVRPTPTAEDLVVLYFPQARAWLARCERMSAAGFAAVAAFNPYWDARGRTFEDADGYRVVLQQESWQG